jgi:hypothetical protein
MTHNAVTLLAVKCIERHLMQLSSAEPFARNRSDLYRCGTVGECICSAWVMGRQRSSCRRDLANGSRVGAGFKHRWRSRRVRVRGIALTLATATGWETFATGRNGSNYAQLR